MNRIYITVLLLFAWSMANAEPLLSVGTPPKKTATRMSAVPAIRPTGMSDTRAGAERVTTQKDLVTLLVKHGVTDPVAISGRLAKEFPDRAIVLADVLGYLDELGVPHESEADIVTSTRRAVVGSLVEEGITDPVAMVDLINFDDAGNLIADFTLTEILSYLDDLDVEHKTETEIIRALRGETASVVVEAADTEEEVVDTAVNFPRLLTSGASEPVLMRMIGGNDHASFVAEDDSGSVSVVMLAGVKSSAEISLVEAKKYIARYTDKWLAVVTNKSRPNDAYERICGVVYAPNGESLNAGLIQKGLATSNVTDDDSGWLNISAWRALPLSSLAGGDTDTSSPNVSAMKKESAATKAVPNKQRRGFPWWLAPILGVLL